LLFTYFVLNISMACQQQMTSGVWCIRNCSSTKRSMETAMFRRWAVISSTDFWLYVEKAIYCQH
jgi:hypothetical protein